MLITINNPAPNNQDFFEYALDVGFEGGDDIDLLSSTSTTLTIGNLYTGSTTTFYGTNLDIDDVSDPPRLSGTITGWETFGPAQTSIAAVTGLNWDGGTFLAALIDFWDFGDDSGILNLISSQDITFDASGSSGALPAMDIGGVTSNVTYIGHWSDDDFASGTGNDSIEGGNGFDSLRGGDGADTLEGGNGNDTVRGNDGNDLIDGGDGNDRLWGGANDDTITGGEGNDIMGGGSGMDELSGGIGNDSLYGGGDNDTLNGNDGVNALWGMGGNDEINASDNGDRIGGGGGEDTINGGAGNDTVYGGIFAGETTIYGNGGDDEIYGSIDNDTIYGGEGDDNIGGNLGDDRIIAGPGDDTVRGFDDADTFVFMDGHEGLTVEDFDFSENDRLELDADLWGGGLTTAAVISTYGNVVGGNLVFDFGDGDIVTLQGITDTAQMANYIDISGLVP